MRAAAEWTAADVDAALAHHPRIGERAAGDSTEARLSRTEQPTAAEATAARIAAGNAAYEARFGRIYLVRAAGRTADDILANLTERLGNDPATETPGDRRAAAPDRAAAPGDARRGTGGGTGGGRVDEHRSRRTCSTPHAASRPPGLAVTLVPTGSTSGVSSTTERQAVTDDDGRISWGEVTPGRHVADLRRRRLVRGAGPGDVLRPGGARRRPRAGPHARRPPAEPVRLHHLPGELNVDSPGTQPVRQGRGAARPGRPWHGTAPHHRPQHHLAAPRRLPRHARVRGQHRRRRDGHAEEHRVRVRAGRRRIAGDVPAAARPALPPGAADQRRTLASRSSTAGSASPPTAATATTTRSCAAAPSGGPRWSTPTTTA